MIVLASIILGTTFYAERANANVATCTAAGLIGSGVSYLVGIGLAALLGEVPVHDSQNDAKEYVMDVLSRCLAREILDSSIGGMLDIVRTQGRDGGASYIRNWRNFQTNAQYRGEAIFRGILANTKTCNYLQQDINKIFRVTAKDKISLKGQNTRIGGADPFAVTGRCTMPSDFDMEKYKQDFSGNGGWGTFLRMLEPQNNYFGLVLQSINEADKQKEMEISSDLNEAQAGRGYTSLRGEGAGSCLEMGPNGKCTIYSNIKSPGAYVADTVAATIQQELGWITSTDELNEIIATAITERLMARLQNLGSSEEIPTYGADPTPPPEAFPSPPPIPSPEPTEVIGCIDKPPAEQFQYLDDIRRAQDRVTIRAQNGEDVGLDPNDTMVITDFGKYHAAVVEELHGAGFLLAFYDGEEIEICQAGDGFSEHSDISTSTSRVRRAFNNSICRPAEIPECN